MFKVIDQFNSRKNPLTYRGTMINNGNNILKNQRELEKQKEILETLLSSIPSSTKKLYLVIV